MATLKTLLKQWFQNGKKPTQEQFWAWMDSYWHKDETIPISAIEQLNEILGNKVDSSVLTPLVEMLQHLTLRDILTIGNEAGEDIVFDSLKGLVFKFEDKQIRLSLPAADENHTLTIPNEDGELATKEYVASVGVKGEYSDNRNAINNDLRPGQIYSLPWDGVASRLAIVVEMFGAYYGYGAIPSTSAEITNAAVVSVGGHSVVLIPPPDNDEPEIIWIAIPEDEPLKTEWWISDLNTGKVSADDLILPTVLMDGYNIYQTSYKTTFDNQIKLF